MSFMSHLRRDEKWVLVFFAYFVLRYFALPGLSTEGVHWADFPAGKLWVTALFAVLFRLIRFYSGGKAIPAPAMVIGLLAFGAGITSVVNSVWGLLALAAVGLGAIAYRNRVPLREWPRLAFAELREWWCLLVMICAYPFVALIIQSGYSVARDSELAHLDWLLFFGNNPLVLLEKVIYAPLSEWLAFAYMTYVFFLLVVLALLYLRENREPFRRLIFTLSTTFVLGYVGYSLVPARGPLSTQHFDVNLGLHYMKAAEQALMERARMEWDCFPSLHTALSLVAAWASYRYARRLFWVSLPLLVSIPFACIYLRYHYVVDVLAGLALATGVIYGGGRWQTSATRPSSVSIDYPKPPAAKF